MGSINSKEDLLLEEQGVSSAALQQPPTPGQVKGISVFSKGALKKEHRNGVKFCSSEQIIPSGVMVGDIPKGLLCSS